MTDERDAEGNLLPDADRLTKVGKFVRSTSIDELPQLINVLKGDMALIGARPLRVPVFGPISLLNTLKSTDGIEAVYCPLGNNKLRVKFLKMACELGYEIPNYIHPSVLISPNVTIGKGVYILLGTTIMPHTVIKDYVMISMGGHLAHHNVLDEGVFISTGCNFGASIHAHKYAYCGISSTILMSYRALFAFMLLLSVIYQNHQKYKRNKGAFSKR